MRESLLYIVITIWEVLSVVNEVFPFTIQENVVMVLTHCILTFEAT